MHNPIQTAVPASAQSEQAETPPDVTGWDLLSGLALALRQAPQNTGDANPPKRNIGTKEADLHG